VFRLADPAGCAEVTAGRATGSQEGLSEALIVATPVAAWPPGAGAPGPVAPGPVGVPAAGASVVFGSAGVVTVVLTVPSAVVVLDVVPAFGSVVPGVAAVSAGAFAAVPAAGSGLGDAGDVGSWVAVPDADVVPGWGEAVGDPPAAGSAAGLAGSVAAVSAGRVPSVEAGSVWVLEAAGWSACAMTSVAMARPA
jgi:hypothetical protein